MKHKIWNSTTSFDSPPKFEIIAYLFSMDAKNSVYVVLNFIFTNESQPIGKKLKYYKRRQNEGATSRQVGVKSLTQAPTSVTHA